MDLELTTWERVSLFAALQTVGSLSLGEIDLGLEVLDLLDLSEEEQRAIGFRVNPNGSASWDPQKATTWTLSFTEPQYTLLVRLVGSVHTFPLDKRVKALKDKLELS